MHLITTGHRVDSEETAVVQEDGSLVSRLKAGHATAAVELVDGYYKQMYLLLRRFGHDHQCSEDLTQEIFIQAWQHIGQLKNENALNGWLYRIASNTSKLYWRRHKGIKAFGLDDINVPEDSNGHGHEMLVNAEEIASVKKAVSKLPIKFREVIVLHYLQQLTINECAQAMGIREGTFKSRLSRALRALKKQIA